MTTLSRLAGIVLLGLLSAGCATGPRVQTQAAPGFQVERYRTYGFLEKLGTDDGDYASVLSQSLKAAAAREMEARGFRSSAEPDLLLNFFLDQRGPAGRRGPSIGIGIGRSWGGWSSGSSVGVGVSNTLGGGGAQGTLTIDMVDRARNEQVWSGSATGEITARARERPEAAIEAMVPKIFESFPGRAAP